MKEQNFDMLFCDEFIKDSTNKKNTRHLRQDQKDSAGTDEPIAGRTFREEFFKRVKALKDENGEVAA